MPLQQKLNELFLAFSHDFITSQKENKEIREYEVYGLLNGFFSAIDPTIKVEQEVAIGTKPRLIADMVFSFGDEKVIVEIKRIMAVKPNLFKAEEQLSMYLLKSGINKGILYFIPITQVNEMKSDNLSANYGKQELSIIRIYPNIYQ